MPQLIVNNVEDFLRLEGKVLATSQCLTITQDIINRFADATFDHQWIHVDEERAKDISPTKSTIAHGYLTLSLLPFMLDDIINVKNLKQIVNYGIDKMIYKNPVPVNSKLRLVAKIESVKDLGNICKAKIFCRFEIENESEFKPVLEGTIIYLYYFNN